MAIVPTGAPAWVRTTSFTHYGGSTEKENYLSRGAINALTDVAAEEFSRMVADLAAVARTAPFAVMRILCNDTSPAAPTVEFCSLMTGVRLTSYAGDAAPSGFPSAARVGNGIATVTFASSYVDEYGVSGAFTPKTALAGVHIGAGGTATVVISGQTLTIRSVSAATGLAISNARFTLEVG
ncbi:MAG TPA: hypothetical protein VFW03_23195 [Gemmatimonadaceae bacterium]|nr:hypothetical protein [Gemmatimonadaceae bacterium]